MTRRLAVPAVILLTFTFAGCALLPDPPRGAAGGRTIEAMPDPTPRTSVKAAEDQAAAVAEGAEQGAVVGRRVGRVAGVFAAIFGGPREDTVDGMVDRYRDTRNAAIVAGAVIGAAHAARDSEEDADLFEQQLIGLRSIAGLHVTQSSSEQIDVGFASGLPDDDAVAAIARVLVGHPSLAIEMESAADEALDLREALITRGVAAESMSVSRNEQVSGVVMHIRVRS